MNILYYSWQENSMPDFLVTIHALGHTIEPCVNELSYYFSDRFIQDIDAKLADSTYDLIFTFNYFPAVSNSAERYHIPYVSWVYDCPHYTLYSTSIRNSYNYIFLFDRNMWAAAVQNTAGHAFHLPLAVNTERIKNFLHLSSDEASFHPAAYEDDISFVGSLYENSCNDSLKHAPLHLRGYLNGIIAAQKQLWGTDVISEVLTPSIIEEMRPLLPYAPAADEFYTEKEVFSNTIQKRITSEERVEALTRLARRHNVSLYSDSDRSLCPNVLSKGGVSYTYKMPDVFYHSKINLNITLRSITSGIPLRALDILGCGGFLLSNYQPELCEYFTPDVDFVYFEDMDDLEQKADYYLSHEKERKEIAYQGYLTAREHFSYQSQVSKMLAIVQSELSTSNRNN